MRGALVLQNTRVIKIIVTLTFCRVVLVLLCRTNTIFCGAQSIQVILGKIYYKNDGSSLNVPIPLEIVVE